MTNKRSQKELYETWYALLDLFSVADAIFTEDDAFDKKNMQKSMGRMYRSWKRARIALDPDFDPSRYEFERPAKWLPSYVRKARKDQ